MYKQYTVFFSILRNIHSITTQNHNFSHSKSVIQMSKILQLIGARNNIMLQIHFTMVRQYTSLVKHAHILDYCEDFKYISSFKILSMTPRYLFKFISRHL